MKPDISINKEETEEVKRIFWVLSIDRYGEGEKKATIFSTYIAILRWLNILK